MHYKDSIVGPAQTIRNSGRDSLVLILVMVKILCFAQIAAFLDICENLHRCLKFERR